MLEAGGVASGAGVPDATSSGTTFALCLLKLLPLKMLVQFQGDPLGVKGLTDGMGK